MKKVIAIDGPSGAGKSTVARMVALNMGFEYLDTGALYRAVALHLIRSGLKEHAADAEVSSALLGVSVLFRQGRVILNSEDVSDEIRSQEAGHYASVFSARIPVRKFLLSAQREAAAVTGLVAEGRDMTTVVFPDAYRKFYLDASVEERARRRTQELVSKGVDADEDRIRAEITERDDRDSRREIAPLRKADDAIYIDSTNLQPAEVCGMIMQKVGSVS